MIRVGSIVRETNDGIVGIVLEWKRGGWVVEFNGFPDPFHMEPYMIEEIEF